MSHVTYQSNRRRCHLLLPPWHTWFPLSMFPLLRFVINYSLAKVQNDVFAVFCRPSAIFPRWKLVSASKLVLVGKSVCSYQHLATRTHREENASARLVDFLPELLRSANFLNGSLSRTLDRRNHVASTIPIVRRLVPGREVECINVN